MVTRVSVIMVMTADMTTVAAALIMMTIMAMATLMVIRRLTQGEWRS
jgi:hypothetical protein